jgi:hypothetical protein
MKVSYWSIEAPGGFRTIETSGPIRIFGSEIMFWADGKLCRITLDRVNEIGG